MAVSILFGCQTLVIQGTTETFLSVAVAASASQASLSIVFVGRCRRLRGSTVISSLSADAEVASVG